MTRGRALLVVVVLATVGATVVVGSPPPAGAALLTKTYTQVSVGDRHSCARATDGTAICWGGGTNGKIGDGVSAGSNEAPVAVKQTGTALAGKSITQIAAGGNHTCAVASGAAYCWGLNVSGQLGTGVEGSGATAFSTVALAVKTSGTPLAGKTIKAVAVGASHSCAVATDGTLACWGSNTLGSLGNGTQTPSPTPIAPTKTGTGLDGKSVASVAADGSRTCVVTTDGNAACWGGIVSYLGDGLAPAAGVAKVPVAVKKAGTALAGKTIKGIDVSYPTLHTCVVSTDGTAACWGNQSASLPVLGNGGTAQSDSAVAVKQVGTALAGKTIASIATGTHNTCAVATDGALACWGSWYLGNGTSTSSVTAVAVSKAGTALAGAKVVGVSVGSTPTACAVASDGRVVCWGEDDLGALGNGSGPVLQRVPSAVLGTGPFAPFTSYAALVSQQFVDVVGRSPSSSELATWVTNIQGGTAPGELVSALRSSGENATNVDPVMRLYWAYFDRIPDYAGVSYWIGRKRTGSTLSSISSAFAGSAEFKATYGSLSNSDFVKLVYANVLDRQPDAAGLSYWTGQLNAGSKTRGAVMIGFSESGEYRTKQARPVAVVGLYAALLHRAPTAAEVSTNVTKLGAGTTVAQLAQAVLASGAYAARFT